MNSIDFTVKKILNEQKGKMYELLGIPKEQLENEKNEHWKTCLLSNAIKQIILISDEGGLSEKTEYINLDKGQKPYYVGYKGVH